MFVIDKLSHAITSTSQVDFTNATFLRQYAVVFAASTILTLVLWLLAVAKRAVRGVPLTEALTEAIGFLWLTVLASAFTPLVLYTVVSPSDAVTDVSPRPPASRRDVFFGSFSDALNKGNDIGGGPIMLIVVSLVSILAAGVLWLELVIRAALLYVGALLGTVVYAGLVDKNLWGHVRRWAGIMIAVILVKPVIVIVLGLAGALSGDRRPRPPSPPSSPASSIILLAIFASAMIYRFVPGFGDEIANARNNRTSRAPSNRAAAVISLPRRPRHPGHQDPQHPRPATTARAAAARRPPAGRRRTVAGGIAAHSARAAAPAPPPPPRDPPAPRHRPRPPAASPPHGDGRKNGGDRHMTTQPFAPRRTYLIGRARPNAIVGKNRETGEIALIIAGAFLGMMCGLLVPVLPLRIVLPDRLPAARPRRRLRAVPAPHVLQVVRDQPQLPAHPAPGAAYRSGVVEAGIGLDGREVEIGPPPGIGRINWLPPRSAPTRSPSCCTLDRRTVTAAIEIEGPGVGLRDSEDQEALVDRFGTLLKHVANGDGFVTRLQMLARTLPADPDAHAKDVAQRGDTNAPAWLQDSYDQLQSMVSTSSEQHRAYLVACMHYTRELAAEAHTMARAAGHGRPLDRDAASPSSWPASSPTSAPASPRPTSGYASPSARHGCLPGALHVRPRPPHRPHPGDDPAQRLARRTRRHRAHLPPGQDPRVRHPRALVPRHGLGQGVADDPGRRQLPRPAARPHPRRHPHRRRHHGPRAHRRRHRADAHREDQRRRRGQPRRRR